MNIPLRRYYQILAKYLAGQRLRFSWLVFLVLASIGLRIINPQIMRYFIDIATGAGGRGHATDATLAWAAGAFLASALVYQAISVGASYVGESVAWTATNALREELALHCLSLDMGWHNDKSPGQLIERIEGDLTEFSNFFSQLVIRVIGNLVMVLGILVTLFCMNWRLGLAFTGFTAITIAVLNSIREIAVPYQKALRDAETELFGFLEERLAGTEDIRSCGAVPYVIRKLYELQTAILKVWRKARIREWFIWGSMGFTMMMGYGIAFGIDIWLFKTGLITMGTAYLILNYTGLIHRPIRELTHQVESLQNIGATVERMSELLNSHSSIEDGIGTNLPDNEALSLEFDGVKFQYSEDKEVLSELSFNLAPGRILGLLGRTGAGKTTMARLVFRLYDSTAGVIRLGGVDIKSTKVSELRQRVAYVTQDVQLFQATVRENITFFDSSIPDVKIMEVINALGLDDWFSCLPNGLDTRLETGGKSLSAGEAQLLALTRVFLRNPGLVILDEASSRLDPATEQLVERAIDRLLTGRTAVIIAHRLATLHRADEILIIEDGCTAEQGERQALLADHLSKFFSLHQTGMEEMLA